MSTLNPPRPAPAHSTAPAHRTLPAQTTIPVGRRHRSGWIRWAGVLMVAVGWGVLAGWWTPRGPITTVEAVTSIALSLTVGVLGGWWLRSRWAMLAAPVIFAVVFEATRVSTAGPLVDAIRLREGGTFGIMAFVLGRGLTPCWRCCR